MEEKLSTLSADNLDELLRTSKREFDYYKRTNNISALRDASEKLFTLFENIVEYKSQIYVKDYTHFKKLLSKVDIGLSIPEKTELKNKASILHVFHRHGLITETPTSTREEAEAIYKYVYSKLKKIIYYNLSFQERIRT